MKRVLFEVILLIRKSILFLHVRKNKNGFNGVQFDKRRPSFLTEKHKLCGLKQESICWRYVCVNRAWERLNHRETCLSVLLLPNTHPNTSDRREYIHTLCGKYCSLSYLYVYLYIWYRNVYSNYDRFPNHGSTTTTTIIFTVHLVIIHLTFGNICAIFRQSQFHSWISTSFSTSLYGPKMNVIQTLTWQRRD